MADKQLQLVVVTPETTQINEPVSSLRFPLFDGQAGILPGRAPLVGRLGSGELHIVNAAGAERSFFLDGGFVQVKGNVVTLLTSRCLAADQIDVEAAKRALTEAQSRHPKTDREFAAKQADQDRARRMLAMRH